jgi:hypothetical protein
MARPLRFYITLMNGEHRIHVNGEPSEVEELVSLCEGLRQHQRFVASGPESVIDRTLRSWKFASQKSTIAGRAHGPLQEAHARHLLIFPECAPADEQRV